MRKFLYLFIILWLSFSSLNANEIKFKKSLIVIKTQNSEYIFNVEVAETALERSRGLMYREQLKQNEGMLFIYPEKQIIKMWMKNTFIPLDMIFIDENGKIIKIIKMTSPKDLTPIGPEVKLKSVLEINGGLTSYLNINIGDKIIYPYLNGK